MRKKTVQKNTMKTLLNQHTPRSMERAKLTLQPDSLRKNSRGTTYLFWSRKKQHGTAVQKDEIPSKLALIQPNRMNDIQDNKRGNVQKLHGLNPYHIPFSIYNLKKFLKKKIAQKLRSDSRQFRFQTQSQKNTRAKTENHTRWRARRVFSDLRASIDAI